MGMLIISLSFLLSYLFFSHSFSMQSLIIFKFFFKITHVQANHTVKIHITCMVLQFCISNTIEGVLYTVLGASGLQVF